MRILACQPGASFSTADVYSGLCEGLEHHGHSLIHYELDGRLELYARVFKTIKRDIERGRLKADIPTKADVFYQASLGIIERYLRYQPDWVVVVSAMYLHPDALIMLRRAGAKVAIIFTESPYDDERQAEIVKFADVAWVNERASMPRFEAIHPRVHYLRHAYSPSRHYPEAGYCVQDEVPRHDVVFVGTGFHERVNMLAGVDWTGIDFGLYGNWLNLPSRHKLRRHLKGGVVKNEHVAALYRNAKIGLNIHRRSVGFGFNAPHVTFSESMNPRDYELAACGSFFLSTPRAELIETFGTLVPTFTNPEELERLIREYLPNDGERRLVASHLPALVAPHTWHDRAREIVLELAQYEQGATSVALA